MNFDQRQGKGPRSAPGDDVRSADRYADDPVILDSAVTSAELESGDVAAKPLESANADALAWLPQSAGSAPCRVRLFCFPHLGGGTAGYNGWSRGLSDDIELVPIYFPGRESRLHEPAIDNMPGLIDELANALAPRVDVPFAFFGHSMGAVVAFELARRLEIDGNAGPICLFVSSCPSPDRIKDDYPRHTQSDEEMIKAIVDAFGVANPDEISLMRMMAPTIRADVKLLETYQYQPLPLLSCPIVAIRGTHDRKVSFPDIAAWKAFTSDSCSTRAYRGGHFFLRDQHRGIVQLINGQLGRHLP